MKRILLLALGAQAAIAFGANAAETVPFSENFDNLTGFRSGWATLDVNNDGRTWSPYSNQATVEGDFFTTIGIDDWLFTPAIPLEQGKTYVLEFECTKGYGDNNPSLEIKYGLTQTPEGMSQSVLPATVQDLYFANDKQRIVFKPTATGDYYFGFHGTGTEVGGIKLDNINIKEATMPSAVTGLTITKSATYGDTKVQVSFRAPLTSVAGSTLQSLEKIVVTRSGVTVKTIENPTPNEEISFEDVCAYGSGNYVWKAVPYGADGEQGIAAESAPVFVGVNAPAQPANVKVVEDGHSGTLTLTWDPVTTDRNGEAMPAEFIDYQVLFNGSYIVPTGATSPHVFKACEPDEQIFAHVAVAAKSSYGSGVTATGTFVAGKPYGEYHESFDNAEISHPIEPTATDLQKPADLNVYDTAMLMMALGLEGDADGTDGCVAITSQYTGYSAGIAIGKFNADGIDNPYLTFATHYCPIQQGVNMKNVITVSADTGNGYEDVLVYDMAGHNGLEGWHRVEMPLSQFKGNDVMLMIKGTIINSPYVLIDNINVIDYKDKNLTARTLSAPETVNPGESFYVYGHVENTGKDATPVAEAVLLLNGREVATAKVEALQPGNTAIVSFGQKLTIVNEPANVYTMRVDYADDMNADDNLSAAVTVKNVLPKYPAVGDLRAEKSGKNSVALTWSAPTGEMETEEITESFENGTDFAHSYGDWTFIDRDGNPAGNYDNLPGLSSYSGPFIANGTNYLNFAARTGNKSLAFVISEEGETNDWAISPRLSSDAQTVSFYACGYDKYGYAYESFRFLASTTGNDPDDFTEVETDQNLSFIGGKEWQHFTFDLPEGTTYFAINYAPDYGISLRIDDITFTPGDSGEALDLLGYNVYRNGVKLNSETLAECNFAENEVPGGDHTYHVTAIYNRGESRGSNPAEVSFEVSLDKVEAAGISVSGREGEIEITTSGNAVDYMVLTADGRCMTSGVAEGSIRIPASAGIYLVATPAGAVKVAVK